ncbi:MAG TPA: hypothetical protein VLA55_02045 [Ornithinibacter sp.]|nr:hypothetical protein [Ornithinibacter sp.]
MTDAPDAGPRWEGPASVVVLVEGASDRAALTVLAERRQLLAGIEVRAMGGATNVRRHLGELLSDAVPRRVLGLTDEPEEPFFVRALAAAGVPITSVDDLAAHGFHTCRRDLEDELIRALGADRVRAVLHDLDLGQTFERFCRQRAWRGRPTHEQLHRFAGTVSGRKSVFARGLAAALDDDAVPEPLRHLLDDIARARAAGASGASPP